MRTRSLNNVLRGHNILRTYSKDKVLVQRPRRKLYWRAYSKDEVLGQSLRRTKYMEGLQQTQGSCTKSKEDRISGGLTERTTVSDHTKSKEDR